MADKQTMPIAIVGLSGRFPGEATDPDRLWDMISKGRDAWSKVPQSRFNHEAFYHPDASRNGSSNVKGGFFLREDLSLFDAPFFGMTQAEAAALDPQQRLLLECCYETFENAGLRLEDCAGSNTGVFVGSFCKDWGEVTIRDPDAMPMYQATGSGLAMLSNRLSYFFDLKGPSVTIDTACSASLVALHLAVQSLKTGDCKSAIVGGVNCVINHDILVTMSSMRFLSPDGRSYTYDHRANGYARGEGVACVLLKPLDDALRDGDVIRAVIRNTGCNQDGRTPGITFPSATAQASLIKSVYQKVGLDPLDTTYVEAHGTGTQAGDPIEAAALFETFGKGRASQPPLLVGSIKTNIGHLEGASGAASLVKIVQMLEHETIPGNANFEAPNERIPLQEWNLEVPTQSRPWLSSKNGLLRASINSFGYGGTNVHVILDNARGYLQERHLKAITRLLPSPTLSNGNGHGNGFTNGHSNGYTNGHNEEYTNGHYPEKIESSLNGGQTHPDAEKPRLKRRRESIEVDDLPIKRLVVLTAASSEAVKQQALNLANHLQNVKTTNQERYLTNLAYTLNKKRSLLSHKAAVHGNTIAQLTAALSNAQPKQASTVPASVFVFTGQGAQWYAMGRELMNVAEYRESIQRSSKCLAGLGARWSAVSELAKDEESTCVNEAEISQPLCTVVQLALVDLLRAWGYSPSATIGHSSGEIAAAYAAGLISHEAAVATSYYRGLVVASKNTGGKRSPCQGSMAAINASLEKVQGLLASFDTRDAIIACHNSPSSFTIAGSDEAIDRIVEVSKHKGISSRKLKVSVAYHSPRMQAVADEYRAALSKISFNAVPGQSPCEMYSTVTGKRLQPGQLNADYWVSNLISPVQFSSTLATLCLNFKPSKLRRTNRNSAVNLLAEIGPHSALAGPVRQILQSNNAFSKIAYLSVLKRGEDAMDTALDLAGRLFEQGCDLNLDAINGLSQSAQPPSLLVDLPKYAWNHSTSYWAEPRASKRYRERRWPRHDLLGATVQFSNPLEPRWRNWIRTSELPWLRDHRVQSLTVYPAAGYITMAIEAMRQIAVESEVDVQGFNLREISIGQALIIPDSKGEVESMISLKPYAESSQASSNIWHQFFIYSASENDTWLEHCRGLISYQAKTDVDQVSGHRLVENSQRHHLAERKKAHAVCTSVVDVSKMYKRCSAIGLDYGQTFANLKQASSGPGTALGTVSVPDIDECMPAHYHSPYVLHPATLDACFHGAFVLKNSLTAAVMPTFISHVSVRDAITKTPGDQLEVLVKLDREGQRDMEISLDVFEPQNEGGAPSITIQGLKMTSLAASAAATTNGAIRKTYFQTQWSRDPDFLTSAAFNDCCKHLWGDEEEKERLRRIDEMSFYMADKALSLILEPAVSQLSIKGRKLYETFRRSRDCVLNAQTGYDVSNWITKSPADRQQIWESVRNSGDEGNFFAQIGDQLHDIILDRVDPLSVAMQGDALGRFYANSSRMARQYQQAAVYIDLLASKNPHLRILEIGAGTGGATVPILQTLGGCLQNPIARFVKYDITDITSGFFEKLKEKTNEWGPLIDYRRLDIEADPAAQGFDLESYDLVIAANVLHATKNIGRTMTNVRRLLKDSGKIVLIELMHKQHEISNIFGIFDGWWLSEEPSRQDSPLMTEEIWDRIFRNHGFSGLDATIWDSADPITHQGSLMIGTAITPQPAAVTEKALIIADEARNKSAATTLAQAMGKLAITSDMGGIGASSKNRSCIILDTQSTLLKDMDATTYYAVRTLILDAKEVLWVTQGATVEASNPDANLVSGILRTLRIELGCRLVHLDLERGQQDEAVMASTILAVYQNMQKQNDTSPEIEFSERGGSILISRFVEDSATSNMISSWMGSNTPELQAVHQEGRSLKLEVGRPGLLDSIYFSDDSRTTVELPADQIEIQVQATAMNFRDIMMAMGQIETHALGCECSGIVTQVGSQVTSLLPGDRVLAYADGTFSTMVRTPEIRARKIPAGMSFEEATTLPIIFCTALHSLKVANLSKGETVLIHAASGGLGQALIQLCQHAGADIYVTVGTAEKKKFVMEHYNIPESHIFTSRDDSFAGGVMRATGGKGVDVIFNSLSSDLLRVTWGCIASFGRFIELGKRDFAVNSRLEMAKFARNVTFAAVDLVALLDERPEYGGTVLSEVVELARTGIIKPAQPISTYGFGEIESALRTMQGGKHLGKLVIVKKASDMAQVMPRAAPLPQLDGDSTYLLVGGLGGIGRSLAQRLVDRGAKTLVFTNRSGMKSQAAKDTVAALEARGVRAVVFECDVADATQLKAVFEQCRQQLPPIKGIFHLGLVIENALFRDMTHDIWQHSLRPKLQGTWNLHHCAPRDLDFFIMLSSMVGVLGSASQAAYGAGSAFQDAFATWRNSLGLPTVTIDLGMVGQVGYVAEREDLAQNMRALGYDEISEAECMAIIESAISQPRRSESAGGNVMTGIGLGRYRGGDPTKAMYQMPQFSIARRMALSVSDHNKESDAPGARLGDLLRKAASLEEFEDQIISATVAKLSRLLMIPEEDISPSNSMSRYGLDSLIAVEMRNWVSSNVEASIPVLEFMSPHSIIELCKNIGRQSRLLKKEWIE